MDRFGINFGIIYDLFWDHFWFNLGSFLGSFWIYFGIIFASLWDHFGIVLGSIWGRSGVDLGSFWGHFGRVFKKRSPKKTAAADGCQDLGPKGLKKRRRQTAKGPWTKMPTDRGDGPS